MSLEELGYNQEFENYRLENNLQDFALGRIVTEHKERYIIKTTEQEYDAEITGNMRFTAKNREDFPAVGDWVALTPYDSEFAIIHKIFPRYSSIKRQAVGQHGEVQLIAVNIDYAFLVQAVDRDFNINRLERYLTICNTSKVNPVIIMTKVDLIDDARKDEIITNIHARIKDVPVLAISNETMDGYEKIKTFMQPGKTYCMLGSSGVGKSTLLNNLSGRVIMKTDHTSLHNNKGRHISSHRELIILEQGGILIDNPGMREVGIADTGEGLETTFDQIIELAQSCRFKDCTHIQEAGCAVLEAIDQGELDQAAYDNYQKMQREKSYFETSQADRKKKERQFGKMYKSHKADIERYKGRKD